MCALKTPKSSAATDSIAKSMAFLSSCVARKYVRRQQAAERASRAPTEKRKRAASGFNQAGHPRSPSGRCGRDDALGLVLDAGEPVAEVVVLVAGEEAPELDSVHDLQAVVVAVPAVIA